MLSPVHFIRSIPPTQLCVCVCVVACVSLCSRAVCLRLRAVAAHVGSPQAGGHDGERVAKSTHSSLSTRNLWKCPSFALAAFLVSSPAWSGLMGRRCNSSSRTLLRTPAAQIRYLCRRLQCVCVRVWRSTFIEHMVNTGTGLDLLRIQYIWSC